MLGAGRRRVDVNRDRIQSHFMELNMFNRFVEVEGLKLFHFDDGIMCPPLLTQQRCIQVEALP